MAKVSKNVDLRKDMPPAGYQFNENNPTLEPGAQQSPGQNAVNTAAEHTRDGAAPGPFGSGYTSKTGRGGGAGNSGSRKRY